MDQKLYHLKTLEVQMKEKLRIDSTYNSLIDIADKERDAEKWEEAKAIYTEAKDLKSDEIYPQQKIDEINTKLDRIAQEAAAKKQLEDLKKRREQAARI